MMMMTMRQTAVSKTDRCFLITQKYPVFSHFLPPLSYFQYHSPFKYINYILLHCIFLYFLFQTRINAGLESFIRFLLFSFDFVSERLSKTMGLHRFLPFIKYRSLVHSLLQHSKITCVLGQNISPVSYRCLSLFTRCTITDLKWHYYLRTFYIAFYI